MGLSVFLVEVVVYELHAVLSLSIVSNICLFFYRILLGLISFVSIASSCFFMFSACLIHPFFSYRKTDYKQRTN